MLVASNGGADRHPAWWLNLVATQAATIQVGEATLEVVASKATAEERARLWPELKATNPFYAIYEQITGREIPVVILRPRLTRESGLSKESAARAFDARSEGR